MEKPLGQTETRLQQNLVHCQVAGPVPKIFVPVLTAQMVIEGQVEHFVGLGPHQGSFRNGGGKGRVVGQGKTVRPQVAAGRIFPQAQTQGQHAKKRMVQHQGGSGPAHGPFGPKAQALLCGTQDGHAPAPT